MERVRPDVVAVPSIFAIFTALTFCDWTMFAIFLACLNELATTADLLADTIRPSLSSSYVMIWFVALARMSLTNQLGPACPIVRSSTYSLRSMVG